MSKSIPAVKDYSIKFYKRGERKPYAEIIVSAPTKFLAKLNARHCFGKKFYAALAMPGYERYTIGMIKSRNVTEAFVNSFNN